MNSARIFGLWRLWIAVDRRFRHFSGSEPRAFWISPALYREVLDQLGES